MDALRGIPGLLSRQRRAKAIAATLRTGWILAAFHAGYLAVLGWLSLRYPLSPHCLTAMAWSFSLYAILPFCFWYYHGAAGNAAEKVARELDHANPSAPDPFRTSLSLENHGEETLRDLDRLYAIALPTMVLPRPAFLPRGHLLALILGGLALTASAILTRQPGEFFRRIASPWSVLEHLPILRFQWEDPRLVLAAGDTVRVHGTVLHALPGQTVFAYVQTSVGETRYPLSISAGGDFNFSSGPVEGDLDLHFAGDNGHSPSLHFRVLPPPFLSRLQAVLVPPGYTRLRPDTLPPGVARFPVLPGTRVTWILESDRPLRRLGFVFRDEDSLGGGPGHGASGRGNVEDTLEPGRAGSGGLESGRAFTIGREVRRPLDYSFWLEDREGIRSQPSTPSRVDLIPDLPPEVDLVTPAEDAALDRDAKLPLAFRVKDDFGITSLRIAYRILSDGKVSSEGQRDCRDWLKLARAGLVETVWDLGGLHLRPENTVEFHFVAVDNDTVNGPKTGRSAVRILRMRSLQEVLAATRQREQSAETNIKSALQRERQLERKLERENQAPREEGPPMLAEYEINRIMVEDPQENLRRTEATLALLQQTVERQSKQNANRNEDSKNQVRSGPSNHELSQVQASAKELQETLRRNEPSMPHGNQGFLPLEERKKNLENLMKSQKEQSDRLAALKEKLDKTGKDKSGKDQAQLDLPKSRVEDLSKELNRNLANQADLQKLLQDQAAQAKAKSDMMDQAIQEQMRMAQDMKSASEDIQKNVEQGAKNGMLSPELLEKMKKVDQLMREVLPDSLREMLQKKLQGQEVDQEELKKRLQEMLSKQAELSENLNRALAMLEQLRDRKRMQELKQSLAELKSREEALEKSLKAGEAGSPQDAEQKSIQQETQKSLADFAAQAAAKKSLQDVNKKMAAGPVQKDMQAVRDALASKAKSKSKSGPGSPASAAAAASASKSAASASEKLGEMSESLGEAMAGMENSIDLGEAQDLLQESLALSRLQLLIRSGSAQRLAEGWDAEETALYGKVAQTAQWLNERVKVMAAKIPFIGSAMLAASRGLASASREAAKQYSWDIGEQALKQNQNLSRELMKLLKMAQSGSGQGSGSGSGSGSSNPGGSGQGQGEGDISGQLQGMSGKQMAINQATYQLLRSMLEGRQPGAGKSGKGEGSGQPGEGKNGKSGQGQGQGEGQGENQGDGQGQGQGEGQSQGEGQGTLPGMANQQGELGENLETLAEKIGEEGGGAQKLRGLADQARKLQEDLRQGRISPEDLRNRQERFQSRLLEAASAMQERGQSETRQAETSRGNPTQVADARKAPDEAKLIQLLREARRSAKGLSLTEAQRKYLDEYYESLLTR